MIRKARPQSLLGSIEDAATIAIDGGFRPKKRGRDDAGQPGLGWWSTTASKGEPVVAGPVLRFSSGGDAVAGVVSKKLSRQGRRDKVDGLAMEVGLAQPD